MKIVKVTYTVRPEFVTLNTKNIQNVMEELVALKNDNINYNACICEDGKTFIHTAFFNHENDQQILNTLASFVNFQKELKASGIEIPLKQELLQLVGSSRQIFK